ncbi:MAG: glycoside hydrolase family 127 protein, partial [Lentisphaeria bacterium]|nr:glycoside hydrolase family 127 protein [Lentisphaeria bacterium]
TWITGDLLWADRCEDVAFNSLPAALTADLRALRYLTAPNMAISDRAPKNPGLQNGGPMLLMDPHAHRCCQHNWGHGWPYFARHLWFATPDQGLAAVLYCDSRVRARVGQGTDIEIEQNTRYPFDESVEFVLRLLEPCRFPLYLRVPGWCDAPEIHLNGTPIPVAAAPRRMIRVDREWRSGDALRLRLPMRITLRRWEANHGSVSVDHGPLTYSLKIGEEIRRVIDRGGWDAYEIHPTSPWNYGLVLPPAAPAEGFTVVRRDWPDNQLPFTHEGTPIEIRATGRRIPEWRLDQHGLVAELQDSPALSTQPDETITLIPMGAARLRISAFPIASSQPQANPWTPPPEPPKPLPYHPEASHCWEHDTVHALCDQVLPRNSNDHAIPRMTWWPRRGSSEWVQYSFDTPRLVSAVEVYWFDDTGVGQCRVPASWRLLGRVNGQWQPLTPSGTPGVEPNRFNPLAVPPLTTDGLRLEVHLREGFSGGILEWRVH